MMNPQNHVCIVIEAKTESKTEQDFYVDKCDYHSSLYTLIKFGLF